MVCVCTVLTELQLNCNYAHKTAEHKLLFETFSSRNRDKDKE